MSRIYYLRDRSSLGGFTALKGDLSRFFPEGGGDVCTQASSERALMFTEFSKVVAREFTCNIILDYERDKLHSFR